MAVFCSSARECPQPFGPGPAEAYRFTETAFDFSFRLLPALVNDVEPFAQAGKLL